MPKNKEVVKIEVTEAQALLAELYRYNTDFQYARDKEKERHDKFGEGSSYFRVLLSEARRLSNIDCPECGEPVCECCEVGGHLLGTDPGCECCKAHLEDIEGDKQMDREREKK